MPSTSAKLRANGHDAIDAIRARASQFAEVGLPRAADAAENAGKAIADFAVSTSRSVARVMREHKPTQAPNNLGAAAPLLRSAGRFAARNPALLAAAGIAVAVVGYAVWRQHQEDAAPE